eukprot:UN25725
MVFSGSPDSQFCIWNAANGKLIKVLQRGTKKKKSNDIADDNSSESDVSEDRTVVERNSPSFSIHSKTKTKEFGGRLVDMAISADGNYLWLGYRHPPSIQIFRILQNKPQTFMLSPTNSILESLNKRNKPKYLEGNIKDKKVTT